MSQIDDNMKNNETWSSCLKFFFIFANMKTRIKGGTIDAPTLPSTYAQSKPEISIVTITRRR